MDNGKSNIFVGLILGAFLGFVPGGVWHDECKEYYQKEAIKHGAAEWRIIDPIKGKTEFHWLDKDEKSQKNIIKNIDELEHMAML